MKALLLFLAVHNVRATTSIPCLQDEECHAKIRSQSPSTPTGVNLCECYANSYTFDYDECEGDMGCRIARCASDACEAMEAYCMKDQGVNAGVCSLRQELNESRVQLKCATREDCYPKIREAIPMDTAVIGVETCQCYADSRIDSMDECQGSMDCAMAMCITDPCVGKRADCVDGTCVLDEEIQVTEEVLEDEIQDTTGSTVSNTASTEPINPCIKGQCLDPDGVCAGEVSCFANPCDVTDCGDADCIANYCGGCHAICLDSSSTTTVANIDDNENNTNVDPSVTVVNTRPAEYTWDGPTCSSDNDCYPRNRERVPTMSEVIGVTTCECYAQSRINPLDECQGEDDRTCAIAGCMVNPCSDARAYCLVSEGRCYLDRSEISIDGPAVTMPTVTSESALGSDSSTTVGSTTSFGSTTPGSTTSFDATTPDSNTSIGSTTPGATTTPSNTSTTTDIGTKPPFIISTDTPANEFTWTPICSSNSDCTPKMREYEPGESETIGVSVCQCYANSNINPLDECQNDVVCIAAMCIEYAFEGSTAYCDEGVCVLSDTSTGSTTNSMATVVTTVTTLASLGNSTDAPDRTTEATLSSKIQEDTTTAASFFGTSTAPEISADVMAINETKSNLTDFVANGTSSSIATTTPNASDMISIDETNVTQELQGSTDSTTAASTSGMTTTSAATSTTAEETEPTESAQNQTSSTVEPETKTSSTVITTTTTIEIAINETEGNETRTNALNETATNETANVETPPTVEKVQEGLPLPNGSSLQTLNLMSLCVAVFGIWFMQ